MIEAAFLRSVRGRRCVLCQRRVHHAVYQRHMDRCRVPEGDEDVVFLGEVKATAAPSSALQQIEKKNEDAKGECKEGEPLADTNSAEMQPSASEMPSKGVKNPSKRCLQFDADIESDRVNKLAKVPRSSPDIDRSASSPTPTSTSMAQAVRDEGNLTSLSEIYLELMGKLEATTSIACSSPSVSPLKGLSTPAKMLKPTPNATPQLPATSPSASETSGTGSNHPHIPHYSLEFLHQILHEVLRLRSGEEVEGKVAFWGSKLRVFHALLHLPGDAQQLFIRLQLRHHAWQCLKRLELGKFGFSTSTSLRASLQSLVESGLMEEGSPTTLTFDEALSLVQREERLAVGKDFRLARTLGRGAWEEKIRQVATSHRSLYFGSMEERVVKSIHKHIGECYRICGDVYELCEAVFTLYSPTAMDTAQLADSIGSQPTVVLSQKMMSVGLARPERAMIVKWHPIFGFRFELLQVKLQRVKYPVERKKIVTRLNIYDSYEELRRYICAKRTEQRILQLLKKTHIHVVIQLGAEARSELERIPALVGAARPPSYLLQFTAPCVRCRCVGYAAEAYEKLRDYEAAVREYSFLLSVPHPSVPSHLLFNWLDRLTLNLDSHLKRPYDALDWCLQALTDEKFQLPAASRLNLQARLAKIAPGILNALAARMEIFSLPEPDEVHIECRALRKGLGDGRVNHFLMPINGVNRFDGDGSGENEREEAICEVEQAAMNQLMDKFGFSEGNHSEGTVWRTLFGLLCYDFIYSPAPDAPQIWLSELQDQPLDLAYSPDFLQNRQAEFHRHLSTLRNPPSSEWITTLLTQNYRRHYGESLSEVSWSAFRDEDQLLRLAACCPPTLLAELCERLAKDHRACRSGFPDLVLWDVESARIAVVEVKGPGDRLSVKQRLWLEFFRKCGVEAIVCYVSAAKNV